MEGRAHIFDYKTKEIGKRMFWDWKGGTNMKGVMSPYKENAMMKASIQTSLQIDVDGAGNSNRADCCCL
jgi:hypothetical protein